MISSASLVDDSNIEFPLTLGRDFSGIVVSKGHGVGDRLKLGDEVWGVVPIERQGCHANYVVVDDRLVSIKKIIKLSLASCVTDISTENNRN